MNLEKFSGEADCLQSKYANLKTKTLWNVNNLAPFLHLISTGLLGFLESFIMKIYRAKIIPVSKLIHCNLE